MLVDNNDQSSDTEHFEPAESDLSMRALDSRFRESQGSSLLARIAQRLAESDANLSDNQVTRQTSDHGGIPVFKRVKAAPRLTASVV